MLKKFCFSVLGLAIFLFVSVPSAAAIVDPRHSPNNRFGIHILEPDDLEAAANLVNGNGGQWGYVTLVIRHNDLNRAKWQAVFDEMRRRRLIPIVRLATEPSGNNWIKPQKDTISSWADFLNSLNWVVQNRYVILFNEPNHAKEWGGEIRPNEYVEIVKLFYEQLKLASADYFILPAGLDTAAPNSAATMVATEYWRQMYLTDNRIFTYLDGWNSHSYPNPGFSGPVSGTGLGSLRSYLAEINYLTRHNLPSGLPVFITETGWVNTAGDLSRLYVQAFNQVWQQSNLVAVTPFVLNYPQPPFQQFSWLGSSHYDAVAALPKPAGQPIQISASGVRDQNLPDEVISDSDYRFFIEFENLGQSIWDRQDYSLTINSDLSRDSIFTGYVPVTDPGSMAKVYFDLKTPSNMIEFNIQLQLSNQVGLFGDSLKKTIKILPPPALTLSARPLYQIPGSDNNYRLLVYDAENRLLSEMNVLFKSGQSESMALYNLVPGQAYRLVLLKAGYLPRQEWIIVNANKNRVKFKGLLPFDFNGDGRFSAADFWQWLIQPINYFRLALQSGD